MEEWQFALDKEVAYKDTKSKHVVAFEASQKMEALDWMKARQYGSMNTGDGFQGEDALSDVLPDKAKARKKSQLALMDKGNGEEEGEEEEATHDPMTTALGKAAQDAEVLSDLGKSKNKELAAKRVLKMVKLIKDVQKKADTANQKDLQATLSDLEKLSKKGKALSLESCKDKLLDAALAVKKVQKTLKKWMALASICLVKRQCLEIRQCPEKGQQSLQKGFVTWSFCDFLAMGGLEKVGSCLVAEGRLQVLEPAHALDFFKQHACFGSR